MHRVAEKIDYRRTCTMEDRELGINLIIDGTSYPLTINASEEPYYRQAARLVNDKLSLYKELFMGEGYIECYHSHNPDTSFTHKKFFI